MSIRKAFALGMALLLVASVAFAGGGREQEPEDTGAGGPFEVTLTDDPMTIDVWAISGAQVAQWRVIEELYEAENPNIDIVVTSIDPPASMRQLAGPAVATGNEDLDILWYWGGGRPMEWLEAGLVYDLEPYFEHYGWQDQMLSGWEPYAFAPNGGIPWFATDWVSLPFLFYNRTIFDEVGIDPDSITTLEDLFDVGATLRAAGYIPMVSNGASPNQVSWLQSSLAARVMGKEAYEELRSWPVSANRTQASASVYLSDGLERSFELMKRVVDELLPEDFEAYDDAAANEAFINGRAAMRLGGSWFINTFSGLDAARLNIPPVNEGGYAPTFSFFANGVTVPAYVSDEKMDRISDIFNEILTEEYAVAIFESGSAWSTSGNVSPSQLEDIMDPMFFQSLELMEENGTETVQHFLFSADALETYLALAGEVQLGLITPEEALDEIHSAMLREVPDGN